MDELSKRLTVSMTRYSSSRQEVESMLVEQVRAQLAQATKTQQQQHQQQHRQLSGAGGSTTGANTVDTRNFLKLLQSTCGLAQIRSLCMTRMETWLLNPKVCLFFFFSYSALILYY
jgi:hypothetical protein